jgi:amidase
LKTLTRDQITYCFSKDLEPRLVVEPSERVVLETHDAATGTLQTPEDLLWEGQPEHCNPATGPIAVSGAEPGDTLAVTIEKIEVGSQGYILVIPRQGTLVGEVAAPLTRIVRLDGNTAIFTDQIRFPIRPMVGVIGVAPERGSISTAHPGVHGGNMDINAVAAGATIYLPVFVKGALLALGDVHAAMGDAEVSGTGIECPATVTIMVDLLKGRHTGRPWIRTEKFLATTGNAADLMDAILIATRDMATQLAERLDISKEDAFMLISATGDVKVGQACNGGIDVTAYVVVPACVLPETGHAG